MNQNVILYSNHCPRCRVLKAKLDTAKVEYTENNSEEEMIEKGFMSAPILEVDGTTMNFSTAIDWIKEREGKM